MNQDAKQFLIRLILFIFPLFIYFGSLTYILFLSGELISVERLVKRESNTPLLFGLAYSNADVYVKMQSVLEKNPEVIALGTSRVMQFRSELFKDPTVFYNAGGAVEKLTHLSFFLNTIPEGKEPKIIILGLDQSLFNQNPENHLPDDIQQRLVHPPRFGAVWQNGVTGLVRDYIHGKFEIGDIFSRQHGIRKIGLNALVNNNGFRNDGSYHYGKIMADPQSNPDYEFANTFARIAKGTQRFQYSKDVSEQSVQELAIFLQKAKERNITVVGFLPPYAHAVYEKMMSMGDNYAYLKKLKGVLDPVFQENGFSLYDFSDLASLGATDKETIDGFHGSGKAYVRLFIAMAKDNKILKEYADIPYLRDRLNKSANDFEAFE